MTFKVVLLACLSVAGGAVRAETPDSSSPSTLPRQLPGSGLAEHDFMFAGESHDRRIFIVRQGKVI